MSGKSKENTITLARFRAFFKHWMVASGLTEDGACTFLGITPKKLNQILYGSKKVSVVVMEEIAEKMGIDPIEVLILGRKILADEDAADEDAADEDAADEDAADEDAADEDAAGEDAAGEDAADEDAADEDAADEDAAGET